MQQLARQYSSYLPECAHYVRQEVLAEEDGQVLDARGHTTETTQCGALYDAIAIDTRGACWAAIFLSMRAVEE